LKYLDYNGTSPLAPSVKSYLVNEATEDWGNPAAEHDHGYAQRIKRQHDLETIAGFLGWDPGQIIFTSGATESINTVLSVSNIQQMKVKSVISSPLEHSATLACLKELQNAGITISWVKHTDKGGIDYDHLSFLCKTSPTSLVSLMHVNNETGVINDIQKLSKIAREHECLIHYDFVQGLGKVLCDYSAVDCDFGSFSGHKIGALKGIGLLVATSMKKLKPIVVGGSQQLGKRAGTENAMAIRSFRLALADLKNWEKESIAKIRDSIAELLISKLPRVQINCAGENLVCNTLNLFVPGCSAKEILLKAGKAGLMISTGSACTSGLEKPSYVISALYGEERAKQSVRISLGPDIKHHDIVPICNSLVSACGDH